MKTIASLLFAVISLLSLPSTAQSAAPVNPAVNAAVRKMLVAMDYRNVMMASMAQMTKAMPDMMRANVKAMVDADPKLSKEQRVDSMREFEKFMPVALSKVNGVMADQAVQDEIMEAMVTTWSRMYTVDEIEYVTTFYSSPVGKKMLTTMPQLLAEGMQAGQRIITPRINAVMVEVFKDFKK